MSQPIRRGDVFWANLDPTIGVEIQKTWPVVVVSNDVINRRSQLVIVVPMTTSVAHLSPSHETLKVSFAINLDIYNGIFLQLQHTVSEKNL